MSPPIQDSPSPLLYKDPSQSVDARVNDLLARMTLAEKVAQLRTVWSLRREMETETGQFIPTRAADILAQGIGHVARPSENKDQFSTNKTPLQTAQFANDLQAWLIENTRLGIPAIFHEEALHGHSALHATHFPQAIALASTFNPELVEEVYTTIAREVRRRGGTQALAPVLDIARDPRWGRFEETLGEDPYLAAVLGLASVRGFQGEGEIVPPDRVMATLKHLAGHGEPSGGLNIAPTPVGERALREVFLLPFEAAVRVGNARSVMASYNEIDGVPSHANRKMLRDILRGEWGFAGTVVSDYHGIKDLIARHGVAESFPDAAGLALAAGVDVDMPEGEIYAFLPALVDSGQVHMRQIDEAVARVLRDKFLLGLFENPFVELDGLDELIGNRQHVALSQLAAEQAITLLKNDDQLLPLKSTRIRSIAVIGPHVHETLLGGYSDVPRTTVSVLDGIHHYLGDRVQVHHAQGTLITSEKWDSNPESVAANTKSKERRYVHEVKLASPAERAGLRDEAVRLTRQCDVAVVVVGENEGVCREAWSEEHLGDRSSLELLGEQEALVEAVIDTGVPTVVVLQNGRPLAISKISQKAKAVIAAWYLGQNTGHALARVLFGAVNPSGKLPASFPRSAGHIPAYYNHKSSAKRGYLFDDAGPLFPFGHGLSYTQFGYSALELDESSARVGGRVLISLRISNVGASAGTETVQLYMHDRAACVTRPVKELKGFARVSLAPAQSAKVVFDVPINLLGFYDTKMRYIVEPGTMEVMIGSSSEDIRLRGEFLIAGDIGEVSAAKAFVTSVKIECE